MTLNCVRSMLYSQGFGALDVADSREIYLTLFILSLFAGVGVIGDFVPLSSMPSEATFDFSVITLHCNLVAWL